jgi:hypothetical protein
MSERTKVHLLRLVVVDHDDLGADGVRSVLENARYPNDCIGPSVVECKTVEVHWRDDHPLNKRETFAKAVEALFGIAIGP